MANRNLQVNLSFKADTSAALKNLETLRTSLNNISSMPFQGGKVITQEIRQAAAAAEQLQHHLGMAMDVKTGNLNLNKLQASLKSSNTTLTSLTGNLLKAGTTGQQAFLATHRAISNANMQLTKSNSLVSQFATTMFSAAKWQAAYGAINMVIQAIGDAVSYAKDLDKSLNNISIVTGYSAERMAKFAKEANAAAKELNTTTTKYTDASLIYFQQGLDYEEVIKRTEITTKLANVVGESAEQVSEWTTAIWNNFAKGGEALESYADKLAALGAATASSADEIAKGLEKFSAIADTVGLSYDYATAALATVTAETRQSADVVGTAFKTLFARMEGLKLGETLEDGTTLNQYSKALESVGINIKLANGDLKDMDTILEEMGNRWQTLNKDQQIALAQSVGGMRQYNQLVALMDNWDKFQTNLQTARDAEGTLTEQAGIYADSWEAAQNKIQTSMEKMYQVLIPKEGIIEFTNGLSEVVDGFNEIVEAAGGLPTVLSLISTVLLTKFQPYVTTLLDGILVKISNIKLSSIGSFLSGKSFSTSGKAMNSMESGRNGMQTQIMDSTSNALANPAISQSFRTQLEYQQKIEHHSMNLQNIQGKITKEQHTQLSNQIKELEVMQQQTAEKHKQYDEDKKALSISKEKLFSSAASKGFSTVNLGETKEERAEIAARLSQVSGGKAKVERTIKESQVSAARGVVTRFENEEAQATSAVTTAKRSKTIAQTKYDEQLSKTTDTNITQLQQQVFEAEEQVASAADKGQKKVAKKALAKAKEALDKAILNTTDTTLANFRDELANATAQLEESEATKQGISEKLTQARAKLETAETNIQEGTLIFDSEEAQQQTMETMASQIYDTTEISSRLSEIAKTIEALDQGADRIEESLAALEGDKDLKPKEKEKKKEQLLKEKKELEEQRAIEVDKLDSVDSYIDSSSIGKEQKTKFKEMSSDVKTEKGKELSETQKRIAKYKRDEVASTIKIAKGNKEAEEYLTSIAEQSEKIVENNRENERIQGAIDKKTKQVDNSFAQVKSSMTGIAAGFTQMATGVSSVMMGLSMLKGTFESFKDNPFEAITSGLFGIVTLIPGVTSVFSAMAGIVNKAWTGMAMAKAKDNLQSAASIASTKLLTEAIEDQTGELNEQLITEKAGNVLQALGIAADQKDALITGLITKLKERKAAAERGETVATVAQTVAQWAQNAAIYASPIGWFVGVLVIAIALLAAFAVGGLIAVAAMNAENKAMEQAAKDKVESLKLDQELIESNRTLTDSVQGLVESYNELAESGESTYEALNKLKEQIPELLEGYEQLNDQGLISDETYEKLKNASEVLNTKYDVERFNQVLQDAEDELIEKELETNKNLENAAREAMRWNSEAEGLVAGDELEYYETMQARYRKLINKQTSDLTKSEREEMERLKNDLSALKDDYETIKEARNKRLTSETKNFDKDLKAGRYGNISYNLSDYEESFNGTEATEYKLFEVLESQGKTYEEALEIIEGSEVLNQVQGALRTTDYILQGAQARAEKTFKTSGPVDDAGNAVLNLGGSYTGDSLRYEELTWFYDSLTEQEKMFYSRLEDTLIDMEVSSVDRALGNEHLFKEAYEKLKKWIEEAEIAKIEQEATNLDIDTNTLETYSDILADNNKQLADNELLSKKVAFAQIRLNKGLTTLVDSWEDISKALSSNERNTVEYAEAIGQLKSSFEEMFGYNPSTDFIESHLEEIQKLVNGDREALNGLQKDLAKDYIANLDFRTSLNEDLSFSSDQIQNTLTDLINQLDTSIAFGEGSTISGDVLDSLSQMVYAGQLTKEELEQTMNLAGYDLGTMDIEWKTRPIEPDIIKQTVYSDTNGDGITDLTTVNTIETEKSISYPIFNGQDSATLKGSTGQQATRTTSSASISKNNNTKSDDSDKDKKTYEDEIERYHELTEVIEDLNNELDTLSEAKDRAWGLDKLAYMDAEIAKTQQLIDAQKQYQEKIKNKYATDRAAVLGIGASLDSQGRIINYEELKKHYIDQYNANLSDKETEKDYERIMGIIEQYEETLNLLQDEQKNAIDLQNQLHDLSLEKIQYKVDFQIEMSEDEMVYLDYLIEQTGDDLDKLGDKVNLIGKQYEELKKQSETYRQGIKDVFGESYGEDILNMNSEELAAVLKSGTLTEAQVEAIREWRDSLLEINEVLDEQVETINESIITAFEKMNEEFDDAQTRLERINSTMESYNNIVDIVGKKTLGISNEAIREMSKARLANANASLEVAKAELEATQQARDSVRKQYEEAGGDANKDNPFTKAMKQAEESLASAQEDFMSRWETALTAAADAFKENVELIAEEFDSAVGGIYGSLDEMSEAFDRQKKIGELYFQNYKKVYEVSKLNRQIAQDMVKTDNVKAQKELNKLAAEINGYNREDMKMSEYDLGYLQKKYELLQAQIALEESQNTKNQMTLQQDAEGNWGYVYTADQSAVDNAQQGYEDAVYNLQDYKHQSEMELQGQYIDYMKEYKEELMALAEEYDTESEEYQQKAQELAEHYQTLTGFTLEELDEFVNRGGELYRQFGVETVQTYEETILGQMNTSYKSFQEIQNGIDIAIDKSVKNLIQTHEDFKIAIDEAMDAAGIKTDEFGKTYVSMAKEVKDKSENIAKEVNGPEGLKDQVTSAFGKMMSSVDDWWKDYGSGLEGLKKTNTDMVTSINGVLLTYRGLQTEITNTVTIAKAAHGELQALQSGGDIKNYPNDSQKKISLVSLLDANKARDLAREDIAQNIEKNATSSISKKDGKYYLTSGIATENLGENSGRGLYFYLKDEIKNQWEQSKQSMEQFLLDQYGITVGSYNDGSSDNNNNNNDDDDETEDTQVDSLNHQGDKNGTLITYYTTSSGHRQKKDISIHSSNWHTIKAKGNNLFSFDINVGETPPYEVTLSDLITFLQQTDEELTTYDKAYAYLSHLKGFDTGGYTGVWGPEGRLAMLHQKEIVLNATDTENLLRTIDMVRSFNDRIESAARATALGLSNIGGIASHPHGGDTLQQEVTIHAEFPNVSDHNEIELALSNLVNDASQYVNRK